MYTFLSHRTVSFLTEYEAKFKYAVKLDCFYKPDNFTDETSRINSCRIGPFEMGLDELSSLDLQASFEDIFDNIRGIMKRFRHFKATDHRYHGIIKTELDSILIGCRNANGKIEI